MCFSKKLISRIRKEEEELEQWRRERELAKKARQMEKAKKVQVQEIAEQTSLPRRSSPSPPTPPPSSPPRSQAPAQQLESEQVGDKSDKGVDGNDNDGARVSPDQRTNQQVDVPVPRTRFHISGSYLATVNQNYKVTPITFTLSAKLI